MGDPKARPALRDRLDVDLDARVRRRIREVLRDLAEPRRAADQLREELDKLQAEHGELKTRLAKIEARIDGDGAAKAVPNAPRNAAPRAAARKPKKARRKR
jgi:aminopeptidase N